MERLQKAWRKITAAAENESGAPKTLYEEPDLLVKVVRDQFNEDFSRLVVAGDDAWETVSNYVGHVAPELEPRLHRHVGPRDVFEEYRIDEQLLKALDRKVWLPSVRSITRVPPEGSHTLRSRALASCSSMRYVSKTSTPLFSCRETRGSRSGATVPM